jgi:MFS family permease
LIPESETRSEPILETGVRSSYFSDIREGWKYIVSHGPVAAILVVNILWASGGGAVNLISDRLGGIVFVGEHGINADSAVAALYFAAGLGLFIGMLIARRVGSHFELIGKTTGFIGWSLFVQGLFFAGMGFAPRLWMACVCLFLGRILLGSEFAVQETLLMRLVPDNLRGRVSTTDRATELLIWSFSTAAAGWSLRSISPRTLTVISGLLSSTSGVVWLLLFSLGKVRLPRRQLVREKNVEHELPLASD